MPKAAILSIAQAALDALTLEELYEGHARHVRALIGRLLGPGADPEDLVQEVFLTAWRKRSQLRGGDMRPWLHEVAVRLASAERRRAWFRRVVGLEDAGAVVDWRTPDWTAESNDAKRIVYAALDKLSERRRTVFILYELQELSGEEIAQALGCPLNTVWTRLHHARRDFKAALLAAECSGPEVAEGGAHG